MNKGASLCIIILLFSTQALLSSLARKSLTRSQKQYNQYISESLKHNFYDDEEIDEILDIADALLHPESGKISLLQEISMENQQHYLRITIARKHIGKTLQQDELLNFKKILVEAGSVLPTAPRVLYGWDSKKQDEIASAIQSKVMQNSKNRTQQLQDTLLIATYNFYKILTHQ